MTEKRIILKESNLGDFRGRTGKFEFSKKINRFSGKNGTGKTTLFDAHTFITSGKNSLGKAKFDIKTLIDGESVSGSLHSVNNIYFVNGEKTEFDRIYKEVWTKSRGALAATKTGNTTVYKANTEKGPKKDYDKLVNNLLQPTGFDESLFDKDITPTSIYKIVSDPKYFPSMDWLVMRKILDQMQGGVIDKDGIIDEIGLRPFLFKSKKDDGEVLEFTVEQKNAISKQRQTEIKDELKNFKVLVAEHTGILNKAAEQPEQVDLAEAKRGVIFAGSEVDKARDKIENFKSGTGDVEKSKELSKKLGTAISNLAEQKGPAQIKFNVTIQAINNKNSQLVNLKNSLPGKENALGLIRQQYQKQLDLIKFLRAQVPPEDETVCFHCKQELPEDMVVDSKTAFNLKRGHDLKNANILLEDIAKRGQLAKQDRTDCQNKVVDLEQELAELRLIKEPAILSIETTEEIEAVKKEIQVLNSADKEEMPVEFSTELETAKEALKTAQEVEAAVKAVDGSRIRINELKAEKTKLSNEFDELEKLLFMIAGYYKQVADQTESIVNDMFDGNVTFRMFTLQENGNLNPTCDIMMDGKPYETALSTGEKVQAGLHIINTMQRYFKLFAPVFIENAESVTFIPEMNCQTFELHHDANVETLTQEAV